MLITPKEKRIVTIVKTNNKNKTLARIFVQYGFIFFFALSFKLLFMFFYSSYKLLYRFCMIKKFADFVY